MIIAPVICQQARHPSRCKRKESMLGTSEETEALKDQFYKIYIEKDRPSVKSIWCPARVSQLLLAHLNDFGRSTGVIRKARPTSSLWDQAEMNKGTFICVCMCARMCVCPHAYAMCMCKTGCVLVHACMVCVCVCVCGEGGWEVTI